jgi:hypothetical protein
VARSRGVGGSLILDSQGLVKLATGDPALRAFARKAREGNRAVITAASTLAEVMRGGPKDAPVHQALRHVTVMPITQDLGRRAGELLGATGMSGHAYTVDALLAVVALAQPRPAVLLTSDPDDMTRLTEEPHRGKSDRIAVVAI